MDSLQDYEANKKVFPITESDFFSSGSLVPRYFFLGVAVGGLADYIRVSRRPHAQLIRIREAGASYRFINPLLAVDFIHKERFRELRPLQEKVDDYIRKKIEAHDAERIGFYYRDLIGGHWTGVNENEEFSPASMLKVVTLIAYLKLADSDPSVFSRQLYYDGKEDRNEREYFRPDTSLEKGFHPVEELIERMIRESGNNSNYLLKQALPAGALLQIYDHLRLPLPKSDEKIDFMSAKDYSLIFRVLYSSTYLSRQMSERALELLSRTTFVEGLLHGVPQDFTVSHKFGERTVLREDGSVVGNELHDCGIVYYPDNPYFICIMTRGSSFPLLAGIIEDISRVTFEEVSRQREEDTYSSH